jgi:arylsulfatase A-like enzyme
MRTPCPNVIVFFTDQQRWDSTGVHNNPLDLTPNFDRMARMGTDVHLSFTPQPVCGPARAALQTGMYQTKTGCFVNGIALPKNIPTLATHFKKAGYQTAYIGKWHLAPHNEVGPVRPEDRGGYDYWLASNLLEFTSDSYKTTLYDNDGKPVFLPGYRADALTDAAIRYIQEHNKKDQPFFLFLSFLETHFQNYRDNFPAPDGYQHRFSGKWTPPDLGSLVGTSPQHLPGYWGMVKRVDECLGRLLDALKSLGMTDDTVVMYTSDHGCHFKTRNSEYKRSCHESSIRVPTAFTGAMFNGGGRINELVSLIDLPPTLLEIAGIPVPQDMQGRSIMPLLHGGKRSTSEHSEDLFIQISESQVGRAIRTHRWKYGVTAPDKNPSKDPGSDKYVEQYLYDLYADPWELTNLIGFHSHREVSDILKERLIKRMVAAGETAPIIENAPNVPSGARKVFPDELWQ